MSGGIDSTVAAMLALRGGLDCTGAVMVLYDSGGVSAGGEFSGGDIVPAARAAAGRLGIPFQVFDFTECFAEHVIARFIDDYRGGRTPNPCIVCNKHLKFGALMRKMHESGMDHIITGHYARVEHSGGGQSSKSEHSGGGRFLLKKGIDTAKDQSYVLYTLTQEQLAHIIFPLGDLTKNQVRELAFDAGLITEENKTESQDICFIPDGDYVRFITEYTGEEPRRGRFIDTCGNDLGENKGVIAYTVGQRRGLGLAMPHPPYVIELRPEDDTVVVGRDEMLYSKTLQAKDINLIAVDRLDTSVRALVKIRYAHRGSPALVHQTDENTLYIEFDEPQRAVTRGQSAVIYDGDTVVGGGIIV